MIKNTYRLIIILITGFLVMSCSSNEYFYAMKEAAGNKEINKPILVKTISVDKIPSTNSYQFSIKYNGRYEVFLYLNQKTHNKIKEIPIKIRGLVRISDQNNNIVRVQRIEWANNQDIIGKTLFFFKSPEEVQNDIINHFEVEITEVSNSFRNEFESINFIIKRVALFE